MPLWTIPRVLCGTTPLFSSNQDKTNWRRIDMGEAAYRRRRLVCAAAQKDPQAVDVGAPERLITSVGLGLLWAGALCECH